MKKVLALLLSVLMIFGTMSVCAFAATDYEDLWNDSSSVYGLTQEQAILSFNLNGGKIKGGVWVYYNEYNSETKTYDQGFKYVTNYNGSVYDKIPNNSKNSEKLSQTPGDDVSLPPVTAPSGYTFNGWYCQLTQETYPANYKFVIPESAAGEVVHFIADYTLTEPEEEGLGAAFDILVKVFGTIIGLLFYSNEYGPSATEYGMKIMTDLLSSLFA